MSDCLGANDASTSALDAETLKQERIGIAMEHARAEAMDAVGMMVERWGFTDETVADSAPSEWIRLGRSPKIATTAVLLRATAPDLAEDIRRIAMDELWRRHMEASREWIKRRAGDEA